jgi:hypothetical protein
MPLPLERWARQAVEAERELDFNPVADSRVLADIESLKTLHRMTWARRQRELEQSGEFLAMAEGTYGALLAYPPGSVITTTSISGNVNLYPNLVYAPIMANSMLTPQAYRMMIVAKITTSTSPANLTITPLINSVGTWTTGGTAVSGGQTLGATGAVALTASITAAFYAIVGDITVRSSGTLSACTAVGMFHYISTQGTSGGLAGPAAIGTGHNLLFGGTTATFDGQVTESLQFGATHTVTTITHNIDQLHFMDWN